MSKLLLVAKKLLHKRITDATGSAQEIEDEANRPSTSAAAKQKKTIVNDHIQPEIVFGHIKETQEAEQDECFIGFKADEASKQLFAKKEWQNEKELDNPLLQQVCRTVEN